MRSIVFDTAEENGIASMRLNQSGFRYFCAMTEVNGKLPAL